MGFISYVFRQFVHPPPIPSTVDLKGQTVLITGSNSGIGLEAASQCVGLEAEKIILAVRTQQKGETAKSYILKSHPSSRTEIEIWMLDMESFDSILAFGKRLQDLPRLDIAMLNAGVYKFDWIVSSTTGIESSLQVNHLATSLLSLLLVPILRKTSHDLKRPCRLTFTSTELHSWTAFKEQKADKILDHLNKKEFFKDKMDRYSVTKLLNVFWDRELASRVSEKEIIINFFNPGSVDTGLHRDGSKIFQTWDRMIGRTLEEGGLLLLDAAVVKGSETHGKYMSEAKVTEVSSFVRSQDGRKLQKTLWEETEEVLRRHIPASQMDELLSSLK